MIGSKRFRCLFPALCWGCDERIEVGELTFFYQDEMYHDGCASLVA